MVKLASELLANRDNKFDMGRAFTAAYIVISNNFVILTLGVIAASAILLAYKLAWLFASIAIPNFGENAELKNLLMLYSTQTRALFFATEAFFYPVAALYITRTALTKLRTPQIPARFTFQTHQIMLVFAISVLITAIFALLSNLNATYIDGTIKNHLSLNSSALMRRNLIVASLSIMRLVELSVFALFFSIVIPASMAVGSNVASAFSDMNNLLRGNRLKVFTFIILNATIVFIVIYITETAYASLSRTIVNPIFLHSEMAAIAQVSIVGILLSPIKCFLYAYMFTLPAVIYNQLKTAAASRDADQPPPFI